MFSALIIDADGKTPATLKGILAPYGFEFTVTENGPEAVNVARQTAPNIILLRAELPLTTGFSVCNRLRRSEDTRKIPIILYASNVSDEIIDHHRNLKTHADQYLRLPVDAERLVGAVKALLDLPEARSKAPSRAEGRARPRLEVEISEPSGARPVTGGHPTTTAAHQQLDRDFGDEFSNLAGELQQPEDDAHMLAQRRVVEPTRDHVRATSEDSSTRRLSGPEAAADGEGGFKAQREALQLKNQLNAKNREILDLKDQLETRERAVLDAKKHHRELQAQIGELETQLVGSQEHVLEARETAESSQRDKQTILKREEGLKTRLEVLQKKLKDTEQELASAHQQIHTTQSQLQAAQQQAAADQAEAYQQRDTQAAALSELDAERTALATRVQQLSEQLAGLEEAHAGLGEANAGLSAQLEQARQELSDGLAAAALAHSNALAALSEQHQSELHERDQDHHGVVDGLRSQLAELTDSAQQERERFGQALQETEDNARQQAAQMAQQLAAAEDSARNEFERVSQNLAAAEAHAHAEIERLQQDVEQAQAQAQADADDAARKIQELEATLDELSSSLDRAETSLHRRREAAMHAQQAIAVALRVLDGSSDSDAS